MSETKLTFGEWVLVSVGGGFVAVAIYVLFLPLGLLIAWMRVKMWEWFVVPYFHAPHVSVWLMFALGLSWASVQVRVDALKKEFYDSSPLERAAGPFVMNAVAFLIAYLVHIWALR